MSGTVSIERRADPTALDVELRAQWMRASRESELPLHRALTMNLIAVAPADRSRAIDEILERFLHRHPCRAFVLILHQRTGELEATVGARVLAERRSRQLVLEQVRLSAGADQLAKVPSLVLPLLVNDIPTLLFWGGPLPDELGLLHELGAMASRCVYDSSLFRSVPADLSRLSTMSCATTDLTWMRLCPWRRALAEAFETVTWNAGVPTRAEIRCRQTPGSLSAGHQLGEWLRERLDAEVEIVLEPRGSGPELEPVSLAVAFERVEIAVRHRFPAPRLRVETTDGDFCHQPFETASSTGSRGDLLSAAADA